MNDEFESAVQALKAGACVLFPTDTVYGLGLAPRFASSPRQLFAAKNRDKGKPVAWLVGSVEDLLYYGRDVSDAAQQLAQSHWPGALTLVVRASDTVPPAFQSEEGTIGLRVPACATTQALIDEVGPLATTSANISGEIPPCTFDEVSTAIVRTASAAIRGRCEGDGAPSQVLDCTGAAIRRLR